MHIYAFGSVSRGDISYGSDIDLLAIVEGENQRFDPEVYSIYSYRRIGVLWKEGNPFAWHLALESKLVFASDSVDWIGGLGKPAAYKNCVVDCIKFRDLFHEARNSLTGDRRSEVFDLSTVFLSVRNIATCYSLGVLDRPDFSRHSAIRLPERVRLQISSVAYETIERARILTTRGYGESVTEFEARRVTAELEGIEEWMNELVERAESHERA